MAAAELRADARRNRVRLIAAAREVFDEQGTDAPLDVIARRARVGNATLYRHFPTRRALVVEVYADEVDALCARGAELLELDDPMAALFGWLGEFAAHVAARRHLPQAIAPDRSEPDGPGPGAEGSRDRLFARWHAAMDATADALVDRARAAGCLHDRASRADLVAVAYGIGLTVVSPATRARLLDLVRLGCGPRGPTATSTAAPKDT